MGIIMKFIALAAMAVAVKIEGIDDGALMSGNHWRKRWPEGVDDGEDDEDVIDRAEKRQKRWIKRATPKVHNFPWKYDDDVITTGNSIDIAEKQRGDTLNYFHVNNKKGLDWFHHVDYIPGVYDRRAETPDDCNPLLHTCDK